MPRTVIKKKRAPRCDLQTPLCSDSLMRRYRGKQTDGDGPVFNACGACLVYLKLGRRVVDIGEPV